MTRLPSLSICLVRPLEPADEVWPLDVLTAHLEAAGHHVETSDAASTSTMPDPDVVHCFGLGAARDLVAARPSTPLLVTPSWNDGSAGAAESLDPVLTGSASVVVRSSSEQAQVHRLGVPWFRTWVLPVAVDVDTFTRLGPMANRTERFRLIAEMCGPGDGSEDVLAAMTKLDDVELIMLPGDGTRTSDLAERGALLRATAANYGVADRIAIVSPGSPGERAWWLRSAHVAVGVPHAPSASGFVAEAMACGTPAVATPVDALADLVVHGVTGFHVPVGDPLSVARAVRMVLEDDFTVESYGMAAADRALSRFAWPRVVHELVGVYRRVASMDRGQDDDEELAELAADEHTGDGRVLDPDLPVLLDDVSIA